MRRSRSLLALVGAALVALASVACDAEVPAAARTGIAAAARPLVPAAAAPAPIAAAAPAPSEVFPHLDDEPPGLAVSTGDTSHGRLFHGRRLEESSALAILPVQRARDLRYGTDELIDLLGHAAAAVHRATGTRLWVGNLGRSGGGDIPWSVSHNAGRDADVAFLVVDAAGHPVDPPDLVPLGQGGWSKDRALRLDVARTWIAVRAMLEHPTAQVQYLFASTPLIRLLLDHAKARGEPARIVARATDVLRQPAGAAPHDDHLHVRVRCSRRDVGAGCVDGGLLHPWQVTFPGVREERVRSATAGLRSATTDARRRAVLRLALLDAREQADAVAARLEDDDASVRAAAARALGAVGERRHVVLLARRFAAEHDVDVLLSVLAGAAGLGGPEAGRLLADAIAADAGPVAEPALGPTLATMLPSPTEAAPAGAVLGLAGEPGRSTTAWITPAPSPFTPWPEAAPLGRLVLRDAAIALAADVDASEPAAPLAALLHDPDPDLRARAASALEGIANRRAFDFMDPHASPADVAAGVARWDATIRGLARSPRDVWIATGFGASGYRVPSLDRKHAWELVRAVAGPRHTSRAARRWLARLEGGDAGLDWSTGEACRHWIGWFEERRRSYRIDRAPDAVKRACWGASR